jgi:hypothetical protein
VTDPSSKRRIRRRLIVVLVAVILAALTAETVIRVRLYFQTGTFGFVNALVEDEASGLKIPRPGRVTKKMRIDSRGFRSPEIEVPKPAGRTGRVPRRPDRQVCNGVVMREHMNEPAA